jgi:hypothetical protein
MNPLNAASAYMGSILIELYRGSQKEILQTLDTLVSSSKSKNLSIVYIKDSRVSSFAILESDCRFGFIDFSKD